jgi:DNA polymerase phi
MLLTGQHGTNLFDKITKTNTVESVIKNLDKEGVDQFVSHLLATFETVGQSKYYQKWIIEQLAKVLRTEKLPKSDACCEKVIRFFTTGVMENQLAGQTLEKEISEFIGQRLHGILLDLDVHRSHKNIQDSDAKWINIVLQIQQASFDDLQMKSFKIFTKLMQKTDMKENAFAYLLGHTLFLSIFAPEEYSDILKDLIDCHSRFFSDSKKRRSQNEEEDLNPNDVLLDILLGFLEKPSALLRHVAEKSFKAFGDGITSKGIDLIFEVLTTKLGQKNKEEEDVEEMEDAEDSDSESSEEPEESSEEEVMLSEDAIAKLNQALDAIPTNVPDEDQSLNDEDMVSFDEKLAELFREKKRLKSEKKDAKQNLCHFKVRVLDLIDIYLKKNSANPLMIQFVQPLLKLLMKTYGSTDDKVIHQRLLNILKTRFANLKVGPTDLDIQKTLGLLKEIHNLTGRVENKTIGTVCGHVSTALVKMILMTETQPIKKIKTGKNQSKNASKEDQILQLYTESLKQLMSSKHSELEVGFFADLHQKVPQISLRLLPHIAEAMDVSVIKKDYRFLQGTQILLRLVQNVQKEHETLAKDSLLLSLPKFSTIYMSLIQSLTGEKVIAASRLKEVLKLLVQIIRRSIKLVGQEALKAIQLEGMLKQLETLEGQNKQIFEAVTKQLRHCLAE